MSVIKTAAACIVLTVVVWLGLNIARTAYNDHVVLGQIVNMINAAAAKPK